MKFQKTFIALSFFLTIIISANGQRLIKGRIIDENFQIPAYAGIYVNDTTKIGSADLNGYFEVTIPEGKRILTFRATGYESALIFFPKECENLEVILLLGATYDFKSSKKIDALRKQRFNKLPSIYLEAFQKGIFKFEKPCFKQDFISHKQRLDSIGKIITDKTQENKKDYENLLIGDTIKVPLSPCYNCDGHLRTMLHYYSYVIDMANFPCVIEGVILNKRANKKGYFLEFKISQIITNEIRPLIFNDKEINVGGTLEYNMKYFKVITK